MESLSTGISAGIFLAYWHGKVTYKDGEATIEPTDDNPIYVYEGGHRTRWTEAIFNNKVDYEDMDYDTLCVVDPDTAKEIRETVIEMTVSVSEDLGELEKFAKRDYERVNKFAQILKPGEIIRTDADPVRVELENDLKKAMKRNLKPKDRDVDREDLRALVHGAAGLTDCMDKKKGSLTETDELTSEQTEKASVVIRAFGQAESEIVEAFTDKKVKTRLQNRQLDLPLDGTFVYALQAAKNDTDRMTVKNDIVNFYRRFFANKEDWTAKLKEIKKATVERSRYKTGEPPYPTRWVRIQRMLRPVVEVVVDRKPIAAGVPQ